MGTSISGDGHNLGGPHFWVVVKMIRLERNLVYAIWIGMSVGCSICAFAQGDWVLAVTIGIVLIMGIIVRLVARGR